MEYTNLSPAQIVSRDIRSAAVFERFGLDFCCKGKDPLAEACEEARVSVEEVVGELARLGFLPTDETTPFNETKTLELIDRIVDIHHSYVRRSIPVIQAHIGRVAERHGERHPETIRIRDLFEVVAKELAHHLQKEEQILFPHIAKLYKAKYQNASKPQAPFGTVQNPIRMMEMEHEEAGEILKTIRSLSDDYTPPQGACNTYKASYAELKEFEEDLHKHIHLENHILHGIALSLEREVLGA